MLYIIITVALLVSGIIVARWIGQTALEAQDQRDSLEETFDAEPISAIQSKSVQAPTHVPTQRPAQAPTHVPTQRKAPAPSRFPSQEVQSPTYTTQTTVQQSDFLTSMIVAEATDSALIGMAVGGDPIGAMIGDSLNDDDNKRFMEVDDSPVYESHSTDFSDSPSHDSSWDSSDSTSYDSSWDSSDSSSSSFD